MLKAVILEDHAAHPGDLDWSAVRPLVDVLDIWSDTPKSQMISRLQGAQAAIINKRVINEAVLDACPELKWVGVIATGTDNIDLEACRRHGVLVANAPGYSTYSVAQFAFSLLLAACQCTARLDQGLRAGYWKEQPAPYGTLPQVELYGKTFGVYGYGNIGRQAARIARGFGMEVLACTRTVRPEYAGDGVTFVDLDTLLARSDVISLHCPLTEQTRGLISAARLAQVKPGCILINTARGRLVDEDAVAAACTGGRLGWYLADAFGHDPLRPESPLLACENTILTPHVAWTTGAALHNLERIVTRNLQSWLEGRPENIVNP